MEGAVSLEWLETTDDGREWTERILMARKVIGEVEVLQSKQGGKGAMTFHLGGDEDDD